MDSLVPSSSAVGGQQKLKLLKEVLKTYEPEQVLYSIIKRIRQLLVLKSEKYFEFSEFAKMQDWQLGKLRKQANMWSEDQLKEAYLQYSELDEKIKTSSLTDSLVNNLDILIATDLN